MHREYHRWHSPRLARDMGLVVYGHWGPPMLVFPTSGGDEREMEQQGMIGALADLIDGGRTKVFAVGSVNHESFYNRSAHPAHRSYVQAQFDGYVHHEVVPFIETHCQTPGIVLTTMGASFGAYHAANTLLKHPEIVKRCFALSGIYDLRSFMDGHYDDNFYFNNPIDYVEGLDDPAFRLHLSTCEIRLATGSGPWENSGPTYAMSAALTRKGIAHHLDDWGDEGGHDWPYWRRQVRAYLGG
jgi:esterase/lipase superfamily enzyme